MRKITVIFHKEPDGWWAESPDIERYTAVEETYGKLRDLVMDGLPFFLGETAEIIEVFDNQEPAKTA